MTGVRANDETVRGQLPQQSLHLFGDSATSIIRNHDRIDILIVEQLAKVSIAANIAADQRLRLVQPALMTFGYRHKIHIRLLLKIEHVPLADQPKADEADAHALVRAIDPAIGRRAENRSAHRGLPGAARDFS